MMRWNREADAFHAVIGDLHAVNPDDVAVQIDQRAAAVALVNRRINLDDLLLPIIDAILAERYRNNPFQSCSQCPSTGITESQRIADRHDPLSCAKIIRISEIRNRIDAFIINLKHGQIRNFIRAYNLRIASLAILKTALTATASATT